MNTTAPLTSSFVHSTFPIPITFRHSKLRRIPISTNFSLSSSSPDDEESKDVKVTHASTLNLLRLSTTLTVISTSLSIAPCAFAAPKAVERRRQTKKTSEALSPEDIKSWCRDLPVVNNRIPYTEILRLKEEGKLKHIVKLPSSNLKLQPDAVLVVLDDSRVLRTSLPSMERDERFWNEWERLELNSACVNAYTPPVKRPEAPVPVLGFLAKVPVWMKTLVKKKPKSKRALEFERARKDLVESRKADIARAKVEKEAMEKALRAQKKQEDRRKRMETRRLRKVEYEQSVIQARESSRDMGMIWDKLARDPNVANVMGVLFFYLFYRVVVLNYRKQKKDYADRLKIEEADKEEKKKMRELEREMAGLEAGNGGEEGEEGGGAEQNPYMKMATQFMQSGARVRRVNGRKLPQYMERGNDVKFSDVAGLGKIRLELEEVVKFFTHGDMYRRRGVKIPGLHLLY